MEERRKQTGAGKGTRSKKSGQSIFFEGYKKHTLYALLNMGERWRPVPLRSLACAANVSEQKIIRPLLAFARRRVRWPIVFVLVDQGYVNADLARFLRRQWLVAHLVRPKKNMKAPETCDPDGCPLCPFGHRLIWEDYDIASEQLIYRGDRSVCATCPLAGTCPKQFEYDADRHETFWGMVPVHSQLARCMMRKFRPRVEPGFNLTKNRYAVADFFINSRHLIQSLCVLSDILETLEILATERPLRGHETRKALIRHIRHPELWD